MVLAQQKMELSEEILDPDFWRGLAPDFNIGNEIGEYAFPLSDEEKVKNKAKLAKEGYIHLSSPGLNAPLPEIANLFSTVVEKIGLPPVFSFVYDELWMLSTQLRNILSGVLHKEYALMPGFWAWRVCPGEAGWSSHRDKMYGSLFSDSTSTIVTAWIPVTEAHPLNSCMYVIPADRDPLYFAEGTKGFKGELADVRALPAKAGDVLIWTQRIQHWGSHSADEHDLPPRMSVSFEYQRTDVEPFRRPLLDPGTAPTFESRLAIIAMQIVQYHHMYKFSEELISIAKNIQNNFDLPPEFDGVS